MNIRKRGNAYQIRISMGYDSEGHQITKSCTFRPPTGLTIKQEQRSAEKFAIEFERRSKQQPGLTLKEFVERFLEEYAKQSMTPTSISNTRRLLQNHVLQALGDLPLEQISTSDVNTLMIDLRSSGYAAGTVSRVKSALRSVFNYAFALELVLYNPCDGIRLPAQSKAVDKEAYYTVEEARRFLDLMQQPLPFAAPTGSRNRNRVTLVPLQMKLFYLLAVHTGCRRGELVGLDWNCANLDVGTVTITKQATIADKVVICPPKTDSGRVVSISRDILDMLKAWKEEQINRGWNLGPVFVNEQTGDRMYPGTPYRFFKRLLHRYNASVSESEQLPEIALHGLRHTSATLQIAAGVDVKTVSGRLGHARTSTTMDIYVHSLRSADSAASEALTKLLSGQDNGESQCNNGQNNGQSSDTTPSQTNKKPENPHKYGVFRQ